ncbi:MAG: oligosaccharide flippase family protein [Azoarcus sp.]|jgi:PST family polysaccharide transporter|nr:oligosaccharide flippase family protein [Azoarcus sp.]
MKDTTLKKISGNAGAMLVSQLALALMPLLLTPYLARTLGVENYGLYAFGLSFIQIAAILTDYGFSLSAVYKIARADGDMLEIQKIVGAVYVCKMLICVFAVLFLFLYPSLNQDYADNKVYFWILSLSVIGMTLQPIWLFQGLERMWKITVCIVASRLSYVFLTLIFVKNQDDLEYAAFFNGITHLLAAGLGLHFVYKVGVWPKWSSIRYTRDVFKSSTEYFWSRIAVAAYGAGAVFFLGTFSTPAQVATYSVAEQFYRAALAVYAPLTAVLYPHMARYRDVFFFKKIFKVALLVAFIGIVIGLLSGSWLIELIFGKAYTDSVSVFLFFMLALAAAIPSILLGYPFLGAMGNATAANRSVLLAGGIQLIAMIVLYSMGLFSAVAVVSTVLIAEICVFLYRIKYAIPYFKKLVSAPFKPVPTQTTLIQTGGK